MISIENLTPQQQQLADQLWSMQTQEEIQEWFAGLPKNLWLDAYLVMKLMQLAFLDQEAEQDLSQAQDVIQHIMQL